MKTPLVRRGWIALGTLVLLAGGAGAWYTLQHPPSDSQGHNQLFVQIVMITALLSGLCFISGTAQWWLKK